jgi:hypothetical protein
VVPSEKSLKVCSQVSLTKYNSFSKQILPVIMVLYAASIVFVLADINSFMLIIVEKIRTGEFFAAKIVSALFIIQKTWLYNSKLKIS